MSSTSTPLYHPRSSEDASGTRMAEDRIGLEKEQFPWHLGVFDAHCHPTDTVLSLDSIASMKTRALTIMATREQDQRIVADVANRFGLSKETMHMLITREKSQGYVVPSFGWHPWFSHQIYDDRATGAVKHCQASSKEDHYRRVLSPSLRDDQEFIQSLPDPRPISSLLHDTRSHLEQYPFALVGEIGLDRAFRIPGTATIDKGHEKDASLTPGARHGRRLSPYRVDLDHQRMLLTAQLKIAGEMQRAVSVHGVASHGLVFETLKASWQGYEKPVLSKRQRKRRGSVLITLENEDLHEGEQERPELDSPKPFPPRICLHSYSGPTDTLKQYLHPSIPADIFFSFSTLVNFSSQSKKAIAVIKAVPDNRILVESDFHAAGDRIDALMEDIIHTICHIKGWSLEAGVKQLASNWMHFVFGQRQ